ncbi:LamG-like jellyroll fold domain-containing protein [Streptomyces goshikiensis]|uniref:LamG-like jellyroll fold domain-containing protein n=1 Tax=Streptomyces goshikiensis TaxID=1942 RepID=UPI0019C14223|nr:LamG-like jellyroll fold domain-containing protein [Streptomyces goshikiensis]GHD75502.1 hypothetical protein GCM10010336_51400 [Streptomyces goshikiensis]
MRIARPLVFFVAFVLAVLAGTEQAALAATRWAMAKVGQGAGQRPGQGWGTADDRAHAVSSRETGASAAGGRAGAVPSAEELPLAAGSARVDLGQESDAPKPVTREVSPPGTPPAQGFAPGASVELTQERARQARTYANPDGTFTTRFYDQPVNFLSRDGKWKEIDTSLAKAAPGMRVMSGTEAGWETRSTEEQVRFGEFADEETLVRLGVNDSGSIGYGIEGAAHSRGAVDGSVITYPEVRPAADLELIAGGQSVKETLLLKDASAPTQWRFPLAVNGLTAKVDEHGGIAFTDAAGQQKAWMPAGWMEDSNLAENANEGAISSGVAYSLEGAPGRQTLVVTLDKAWLTASERVFPVKVDPSVTGVSATSGTYVEAPYNQNFASDTVLKAGTYDGGGHKAASFLRFDGLSSGALKNAWVVDARLALYNSWSNSCTARPVTVHEITSNWSETSTSAYPGPATGSPLGSKSFAHGWRPSGTTSWSCGPAWESIPLGSSGRTLVDDWTHGRKPNYGLAVKASASDSNSWKQFGSDDYPNGKPSLDVTWTKYGATYKLGQFVTPMTATTEGTFKVTVINQGQETWPKNGNIKLKYELYDAANKLISDADKIRWTLMPSDIAPGSSVTLDAKIAPLAPGTYTLVWTMDDLGVSAFTTAGVPGAAVRVEAVNTPPQLTGEAPPSGTVVDTLTPALWASATDLDRSPNTLTYQFEVCEVVGKDTRSNCRTGPSASSQSWNVPTDWLKWSTTYAWYAYASDSKDQSKRPGPSLLTTQVPQPAITSHLGGADTDSARAFGARSGNYATAATDAAVSTIGPELAVTRTYNSQDPRSTNAFGAGWATRWDMRAAAEGDGNVVVTRANGSQARFGRNSDGTYSSASGATTTLTAVEGGGWMLRDASGTVYAFDSAGLLTKVTDGFGREQALTYSSGGRLATATDATSQRSLSFTWSGNQVKTVSTAAVGPASAPLTWTYTYSGDRLIKVCPPDSATACTVYEYADGSHYRGLVQDANPVGYWRLNETEGESAASEAVSRTGLNAGHYRDVTFGVAGALTGTGNKATSFNGTNSYVELPESTLSSSTVLSVELWFKTDKPGTLVGFQDKRLTEGQPDWWNPVLGINQSGKLHGGFELSTMGTSPITSPATVTDNAWHHAVLTSIGTSQTLYLDGQAVGTRAGTVDHYGKTFTYLGAGYSSAAWDGAAAGVRRFTGAMDEVAVYHRALGAGAVAAHYAARTGSSKLTRATLPSGRVSANVVYNGDTERATEVTDDNGGTWKISAPSYSAGSAAYANAVRSSTPANYWRLGDSSGAAAADEIPSGGDGSYRDGVTLGAVGAFLDGEDGAITLDGAEGAVQVPAEPLSGQSALSAELWFRTDKPSGVLLSLQNTALDTTPQDWNPSLLIDGDGKLRGHLWNGQAISALTSSKPVTDNVWHHAVIAGSATGQALYLDGVKIASKTGAVAPESLAYAYLGAGYSSSNWDGQAPGVRYFSGQLDEAALYGKELDAKTVADHFKARNHLVTGSGAQYRGSVMADAPTGYWPLDETSGTSVINKVAVTGGNGAYTKAKPDTAGAFGIGDGSAVEFTGDGYAELPPIGMATTDVAVELWFKTSKPGVLLSNQELPLAGASEVAGDWAPVLYVGADGKLHGEYFSGVSAGSNASSITVTDNAWHHAVVSARAATQTLYLDGTQVAQKSNAPVNHEDSKHTYIGAGFAKNWVSAPAEISFFTGQIDEVSVYQHALTGSQVSEHYRARSQAGASSLASTVTVTDPAGAVTSTTYDAIRGQRPVASADADGGVTTYAYDTGGFPHTVTDPNGHSTITGHDSRGNTVSTTTCRDSNSCWTSYATYFFNAADPLDLRNDKPTSVRDARSADPDDTRYKTTTSYTTRGLPFSVTLADGRQSITSYTAGTEAAVGGGTVPPRLVSQRKTPGGATTKYTYYANGDIAQVTAPSGLATTYTYDAIGRKLTETQASDATPDGVTTSYTYNAMSRISSESAPGAKNEVTGVTHTANVSRTYDADGQLLTESTQDTTGGDATRTTTYHYNAFGLNDSAKDAAGNESTFTHDLLGRMIRETDPAGNVVTHAYTKRGQLAESVLKDWTGHPSGQTRDLVLVSNAYDPAGRLASTTDAMGATTAFTYYDDGLKATATAKQVTQSDGSKHDIVLESNSYDGAGNPVSQTSSGGRTTVNTVDATGRTTRAVFDPNGLNRVSTFAYDNDDRITEQTQSIDDAGKKLTSTTEYDAAGNPKKATVTDGTGTRTSSATYDQRGMALTQVTPRGNTTTSRYDALGRLIEQTMPQIQAEENGNTAAAVTPKTLTGYNTFGETTESRDARGQVTRTETDKLGRPVAVTLPAYTPPGGTAITAVSRTTYDKLGNPASTTDPLGRATYYVYDQLGNQIRKTDPAVAGAQGLTAPGATTFNGTTTDLSGGGVSTYTWTPTGLPLSATDPTGARTESTYDELGRKLTATTIERKPTLQNLVSRYTWDDAGNQIGSTTPGGRRTTTAYDTAGQALAVTDPLGGITRAVYDGLGRATEGKDATGRKTVTAYDVMGKPTSVTDYGTGASPLRSVATEYDADGNVTASVSASGARRTYTYDALGQKTKQVEPVTATDSITTTFGYDAAGHRTRLTDGRGKATYYTFNTWGLPESTIEPATTQHWAADVRTWTNVYDAAGQLTTEQLPGNVKRQKTYDALGRLTVETGSGTSVATRPRTLSYDLAGRMTGAGGDGILTNNTYTYNDRGQLLSTDGPGGTSTYTYDADGQMTSRTDAAGATAFTYDPAGRLGTTTDPLTGTQVRSGYDAAGRPTVNEYARPAAGGTYTIAAKRSYTYDALGRLANDSVTRTGTGTSIQGTAYEYDLDDRLVKKTAVGTAGAGAETYAYDLAGRMTSETSEATTTPYEWDKSGNLTKRGDATATYDSRNRVETWGTQTFAYSARGTEKTVTESGTSRQINSDAFERTITNGTSTFTYDSLDRVMTHNGSAFIYDGGSNNLAKDGTSTYSRTPGGTLLSSVTTGTAGSARLAVTDGHTDLVAGLTPDGTSVASSRAYDALGKVTASNGITPSVGYQSGWTDASTGEVNMASRWYQPGIGSFTSRDTWQLDPNPSAQANRYTYANAGPLNGTDPTGHRNEMGGGSGSTGTLTPYSTSPLPAPSTSASSMRSQLARFLKLESRINRFNGVEEYFSGNSSTSVPSTKGEPFRGYRNCDKYWYTVDCGGRGSRNQYDTAPSTGPGTSPSTSPGVGTSASSGSGPGGCRVNCRRAATFPPPPPIDQNPNNGRSPIPAPRHIPKPNWDPGKGGWDPKNGVDMVIGALNLLNMLTGGSDDASAPDQVVQPLTGFAPIPGSDSGAGGSTDDDACDTGVGWSVNKKGVANKIYLPRKRQAGACVASGAYADLTKDDYVAPPRPGLGFALPGLKDLPGKNRARGHLIGFAMGGSNTDTRNFVPMYQSANQAMYDHAEDKVVTSIKKGGNQFVHVTPVYDDPTSVIPTKVNFISTGTVDVRCEFDNTAAATYRCW